MPFRLVYTEFWQDPKVMEEMTPEDKYFYLYLLTNPCTNMIGVYRIVKKQMAFDLGYSIESINSLMDRFINYHKLIKYNENTKELCIVHYGKYNLNRGGKPMLDCIKKDLSKIDDISLIEEIVAHIKHPAIKSFIEDYLSKLNNDTSDDTSTTSEREADKTINHKPKTKNHNPKSKTTTTNIDNSCSSLKGNLNIFKHFEKCGFAVTAMLMEQISADIEVYNKQWLMDAATEAMNRGKINNYKYVLGILQNWTSNGRNEGNGNGATSKNNREEPAEWIGL
ncbi:replication protein [Clostridium sp. D53t1_180928_C8]|uniref:replication protein n=1 Tax=Clostridium sp. D53t1_180928_C8 TaxID=2787101 RepID=UPI0018AC635A|nr:replication protein [Clostridium sp. D53t1_180928_C8]